MEIIGLTGIKVDFDNNTIEITSESVVVNIVEINPLLIAQRVSQQLKP